MPRRDQRPPYEILRHNGVGAESPHTEPSAGPRRGRQAQSQWRLGGAGGNGWGWLPQWLRGGPEIEIRLPRALALALCVGLVGTIILAFGLGYFQGSGGENHARTAPNHSAANAGMVDPAFASPPPRGSGNPTESNAAKARNTNKQSSTTSTSKDPRQPGLNYMVLANPKREDAGPLVEFLARRGVKTTLVAARNGSVQVVAVNEGFAADELNSEIRDKYENWLRRVGRSWNRHHRNRGYDLSSMYLDKYQTNE